MDLDGLEQAGHSRDGQGEGEARQQGAATLQGLVEDGVRRQTARGQRYLAHEHIPLVQRNNWRARAARSNAKSLWD